MKLQLNAYFRGDAADTVIEVDDEAFAKQLVEQGAARLPDPPPASPVVQEAPPAPPTPPEPEPPKPGDVQIESLDITPAKKQALFKQGLNTARDVVAFCETDDLQKLDGIGAESAAQILKTCQDAISI